MAYWALEALDGSKTALSSLDRVEGTDPPAYKIGRRPHEESHFGTLPICVSRNQAQLTTTTTYLPIAGPLGRSKPDLPTYCMGSNRRPDPLSG